MDNNIQDIKIKDKSNKVDRQSKKPTNRSKRLSLGLVVFLIIASLIFGAIGGVGGIILLSNQGQDVLKSLGITEDVKIPTTQTKEIVVEESSAVIEAVDKVRPSVVSVIASEKVLDLFGNSSTQVSGGSGFIVTSDGYIVTNKHVVSNQNLSYEVYLNDGTKYNAKVESRDPFNDLAILRIEATGLPVVDIGSSDNLDVGQYVIAVGNALGEFQNTVTLGIVSAKNRSLQAQGSMGETESLEGLIQVDAAINSGNSGGPLANLDGRVVGVNVAKAQQADNIGFAIPSSIVKTALDSLNKYGKIVRPFLGVRYVNVTPELAEKNNLGAKQGAIIYTGSLQEPAVVSGSPADRAGLKERDIITKINDAKVSSTQSLSLLLQQYAPGDTITVSYIRNGNQNQVEVNLARHDNF
jgi:serine protease Do